MSRRRSHAEGTGKDSTRRVTEPLDLSQERSNALLQRRSRGIAAISEIRSQLSLGEYPGPKEEANLLLGKLHDAVNECDAELGAIGDARCEMARFEREVDLDAVLESEERRRRADD